MAVELRLQVLGGLTLTLTAGPLLTFISSKAPALLAYLAVTRRPQPREALAGLLWGELADADAKNNLRQTLSSLRRSLEPYLLIDRDTVGLNPAAALWLDSEAFERSLAAAAGDPAPATRTAHLRAAAALYQGDFLAGCVVRDAPEFDDWLLAQRARYRELALHTLHTLTQLHLQRGDTAEAIDSATRLLTLEAWREEAHRQLMVALARSGQRSAALAQYETCRRLLAQELRVEPSAETTTLYERIATAKRRVHLPPAATPFVGRTGELAQIAQLLADPTGRLITLVGPGGGGKTRLALEAAARATPRFLHGVCFVSLAAAEALAVAPSAVAEALEVTLSGKVDPREQLLAYLRDKELLLVLDNLEHLAGADEWVGQLAQAGPEVRLLVTSRERLNLHGERLLEVSGLDSPPEADGAAIGGYSATQLFVNSAQAGQPGFRLTGENAAAVGRICRLVHGLPLALELAAAWVRQLSCRAIADEIEHNLSFLATSQKNVPARHRSLEAAFEHSWALLAADERRAFARLAVFRGGCEREAALAVGQCAPAVLAALADKSLVRLAPDGRLTIHELLRQFADSKLLGEPQAQAEAQAQHAAYYLGLVAELEDALNDAGQAEARQTLATEVDNWRAAWAWAVAQRQLDRLEPALESLRIFLDRAGWYAEGVRLYGSAAEAEQAVNGEAGPLYGQLITRLAWFYHRLDQFEAAQALLDDSLAVFGAARPSRPAEAGLALQCLANLARARGDFAQAVAHGQASVAEQRAAGNPRALAAALNTLGTAYTELGDLAAAQHVHTESLALKRAMPQCTETFRGEGMNRIPAAFEFIQFSNQA